MSKDLEDTVRELGPEYQDVVDRLRSSYLPWDAGETQKSSPNHWGRAIGWSIGYLVAASLLVLLAFGFVFNGGARSEDRVFTVRASTAENEYRLAYLKNDKAVQEMIRTQQADGSWKTDFLTRQNAEALRSCEGEDAKIAYKKAVRNLRSRGML